MKIAVAKEIDPSEPRVAASPDTVKKFKALGAEIAIEPGAGLKSGLPDSEFTAVGATVSADALKDADIIIKVKRPEASELAQYKRGALVIAIMDPYGNEAALKTIADAGVSAFAMELMPRITRAQSMDALSSMATIAGYKAVILAADALPRMFPMLMTAAGTITPARVFVLGAGVAGLQAIATARRLGGVVDLLQTFRRELRVAVRATQTFLRGFNARFKFNGARGAFGEVFHYVPFLAGRKARSSASARLRPVQTFSRSGTRRAKGFPFLTRTKLVCW